MERDRRDFARGYTRNLAIRDTCTNECYGILRSNVQAKFLLKKNVISSARLYPLLCKIFVHIYV